VQLHRRAVQGRRRRRLQALELLALQPRLVFPIPGNMVLLVAAIATVASGLVEMLVIPWLTSRTTRMNAGAVFISLLFWNWIWGVWGLLLGIPITMVFKTICDHIESCNSVGELLGEAISRIHNEDSVSYLFV
jgi:predicted PurR-regulated permease PerM